MKKLVMIAAMFVAAVSFTACGGGAATLDGKYQLDSVSGEELTETEKSSTIEFTSDGNCVMKRGDREKKGTWKISEDGKSLTLTEEGDDDAKEMKNLEITDGGFSFMEGDDKITFKKAE
ncbi:MAG: lipocalin family protein [Flavobacteriales bacterium]